MHLHLFEDLQFQTEVEGSTPLSKRTMTERWFVLCVLFQVSPEYQTKHLSSRFSRWRECGGQESWQRKLLRFYSFRLICKLKLGYLVHCCSYMLNKIKLMLNCVSNDVTNMVVPRAVSGWLVIQLNISTILNCGRAIKFNVVLCSLENKVHEWV